MLIRAMLESIVNGEEGEGARNQSSVIAARSSDINTELFRTSFF